MASQGDTLAQSIRSSAGGTAEAITTVRARIAPPIRSPAGVAGKSGRIQRSQAAMNRPIQAMGCQRESGSPSSRSSKNPTIMDILLFGLLWQDSDKIKRMTPKGHAKKRPLKRAAG